MEVKEDEPFSACVRGFESMRVNPISHGGGLIQPSHNISLAGGPEHNRDTGICPDNVLEVTLTLLQSKGGKLCPPIMFVPSMF